MDAPLQMPTIGARAYLWRFQNLGSLVLGILQNATMDSRKPTAVRDGETSSPDSSESITNGNETFVGYDLLNVLWLA